MNRSELREALVAAGVPDQEYEIPGIHDLSLKPTDFYYLRQEGDSWVVGVYERGRYGTLDRFDGEEGACRFLYAQLTNRGPAPAGRAEKAMEGILRDSEEIQRAAWEDFERARRKQARREQQ